MDEQTNNEQNKSQRTKQSFQKLGKLGPQWLWQLSSTDYIHTLGLV